MNIDASRETTILLVRHARAVRPPGLLYGHLDYPADLSDIEALRSAANALPDDCPLLSSDLLRCKMTAEALRQIKPDLRGPVLNSELREQNFGEYEGKPRSTVAPNARNPYWLFARSFRPPRGESFDDLVVRAARAMSKIALQNLGKKVAAVTHGNFIRAALAGVLSLEGDTPETVNIPHCGVVEIRLSGDKHVDVSRPTL